MHNEAFQYAKYAYSNVNLYKVLMENRGTTYKEVFGHANWNNILLIDKTFYIYNESNYSISDSYINEGRLKRIQSVGATGKCIDVYWNDEYMYKSKQELSFLRQQRYGIGPLDKCCCFYSLNDEQDNEVNNVIYQIKENVLIISEQSLTELNLDVIYQMLYEYNPTWIILRPSIAIMLSMYIEKNNVPLISGLHYIEIVGEYISYEARNYIRGVFKCVTATQYRCDEANTIAYECNCGNLHCISSNSYVEIINNGMCMNDGQEGVIHVTSLNNPIMPFVRYELGDRGILYRNVKCACGCREPILQIKNTRCMDKWIVHDNGKITSPYVVANAIKKVNVLTGNVVKQFNVQQDNVEELTIKLVTNKDRYSEENIMEGVMDCLDKCITSDLNVYFQFYDELFPESSKGRLSFFRSKIV